MRRTTLVCAILIALLANISFLPIGYVERLWQLRGVPYSRLTCSAFIDQAHDKTFIKQCGSLRIWQGRCPNQTRIAEFASLDELDHSILKPGDILAFHGDHVAAYAGEGTFLDSDPSHANQGVGVMQPNGGNAAWFRGRVRVIRWTQ